MFAGGMKAQSWRFLREMGGVSGELAVVNGELREQEMLNDEC